MCRPGVDQNSAPIALQPLDNGEADPLAAAHTGDDRDPPSAVIHASTSIALRSDLEPSARCVAPLFTTWQALGTVVVPDLPNAFEITESLGPHGVRLHITGELDVAVINRLQDRIDSVARPGDTVILDLSELSFIDSSGLNVIVNALRLAKQDGWELRIEQGMSRPVQRVVQLMGLDVVFWAQ